MGLTMTMNANILMAGLGLLAAVAYPAVAMAKTHHVRVHHTRVAPVVPQTASLPSGRWADSPAYGYGGVLPPLYTRCGFIRDRQTYGLHC
jgi:hypothetical protein